MPHAPAPDASLPDAPLPLSIFLIVRNEADRLGATLAAVRELTDDLVVIDSHSTDDTVAVAERHGARVIRHDFEGYGPQKRFAEDQCRHDWVLNLDADEVVPPSLAKEIRALFGTGTPPRDAYAIRIAEVFPGEPEAHRLAYALAPVRLYRRSRGRYSASPVHDRVDLAEGATVGRLRGTVQHYSVRSLGDQIVKLNRYSDLQADDLERRGVTLPVWRLFLEFPAAFLKAYIGRRHFVRGAYGYLTAMNYAFSRHLRVAKNFERRRLPSAQREAGKPPAETERVTPE